MLGMFDQENSLIFIIFEGTNAKSDVAFLRLICNNSMDVAVEGEEMRERLQHQSASEVRKMKTEVRVKEDTLKECGLQLDYVAKSGSTKGRLDLGRPLSESEGCQGSNVDQWKKDNCLTRDQDLTGACVGQMFDHRPVNEASCLRAGRPIGPLPNSETIHH